MKDEGRLPELYRERAKVGARIELEDAIERHFRPLWEIYVQPDLSVWVSWDNGKKARYMTQDEIDEVVARMEAESADE